jgi:4-amino-4-deoxy-L-arabinose transferase-like glycosyltransferase
MARLDMTHYALYRWRFIIGYTTIGALFAGLLVFSAMFVPNGLSDSEMTSVIKSASINFSDPATLAITHLPYQLLQAASMSIFGANEFAIKLPSLILGFFTAAGLILLLRRWFRPSIAILASLIAVTTGQFLFISQLGAAGILFVFWPVALLYLGTQVTRVKKRRILWKLLFAITAALSLYSPLSIYTLLAIAITIALHPHLRAIVRRLSKPRLAICIAAALVIVSPLAYIISLNPQFGLTLLGVPAAGTFNLMVNVQEQVHQYFNFASPSATTIMTPVFGLGTMLLILIGLYRLIRTRDTTRSYLVIIWIVCLIPALLMNPRFTSVVFLPAVLLLAAGLTSLISYWYRLFPLNPYARVAGLLPIGMLVFALILTGVDRFAYGYHYSPNIASNFSRDVDLLPKGKQTVLVSADERPLYDALAKYRADLTITQSATADTLIATRAARMNVPMDYAVTRIVTNPYAQDADRFYQYQKNQ